MRNWTHSRSEAHHCLLISTESLQAFLYNQGLKSNSEVRPQTHQFEMQEHTSDAVYVLHSYNTCHTLLKWEISVQSNISLDSHLS